jgi:hypothetical protein
MKLSMVTIALTFFAFVFGPVVVHADRMVRFLFNNGVEDASLVGCNADDDVKIDMIFNQSGYDATYVNRNLLRSENKNDLHENHERELQLWHPKCKKECAGWAPRTCRATDCVGYRRQLGKATTAINQRGLQSGKSFSCTTQVNYLHTELNNLVTNNLVSTDCKTLLNKPRNVTCFDDVIYGVVEYFKLWITDTIPQTVNSNGTDLNVCRSAKFTFEVITNDCVDYVLTSLTGPTNGYYKNSAAFTRPFSIFGDNFNTNGSLIGFKVPYLGQYTITSIPDSIDEKVKVMTFNVVTGPVESIKLWDTAAKTILNSNFTGGNICRNKGFAFEIVVSSCADSLKSTLTGPGYSKTRWEEVRPFFGVTKGTVFNGIKLSTVGEYTLTIYPDQEVSNMVKTMKFKIVNC